LGGVTWAVDTIGDVAAWTALQLPPLTWPSFNWPPLQPAPTAEDANPRLRMTQGVMANGDSGLREIAPPRHLVRGQHLDQKVGGRGGQAVELLGAADAEDFAEDVMVHLHKIKNG